MAKSKNPVGRPRNNTKTTSAKDLAREIAAQTENGQEVVDFVLAVFRGEEKRLGARPADLKWAVEFLAERLWGKAPIQMEITAGDAPQIAAMIDYSKLSTAQLKALQKAEEAIKGVLEGEVIDV